MVERVPSGIVGLDALIEGGFPRGTLIVLSGPPGSGKSTFGFQFLSDGILKRGETGLFVSLLEEKQSFYSNFSRAGFRLDELDKTGRFTFVSLVAMREESIPAALKQVVEEISSRKVTLLVIDSFTAIREAFRQPIDARIILNSILGKMVRTLGCTTILIVEKSGIERGSFGMEEFVADGVINLESFVDGLEIRRRALITKMRGTNHSLKYQSVIVSEAGIRLTPMVG
jgi:circadian clock protein KaiC